MQTTHISSRVLTDADLIIGINKALQCLMEDKEFSEAFLDSLNIIASLGRCYGAALIETPKLEDSKVGIVCDAFIQKKKDSYEVYRINYFNSYSKESPYPKWLEKALQGEVVEGDSSNFTERWRKAVEHFQIPVSSFKLYPLFIDGALWGILVFYSDQVEFDWSKTERLAIETFVNTLANLIARRRTERKLIDQRDYLRKVIDLNPNQIFAKNSRGQITLANQATADFYDLPKEDLIGKTDKDLGHSDDEVAFFTEEDEAIFKQAEPIEFKNKVIKSPKGEEFIIDAIKSPIVNNDGVVTEALCMAMDITEQMQMQRKLAESERFKHHIASILPDWVMLIDLSTMRVIYTNRDEFLGYKVGDYNNPIEIVLSIMHPDDLAANDLEAFIAMLSSAGDETVHEVEYRLLKNDSNQYAWIRERSRVFKRDDDGVVLQYLVVMQDVTERKTALEQIENSKDRYQNFIRFSIEGIYYVSCGTPIPIDLPVEEQVERYYAHAYIEECNESMAKMYGLNNPSELLNKRVLDVHKGEFSDQNQESFIAFIKSNYRVEDVETIEKADDGSNLYFRNRAIGIIEDGHLIGVWGVQQDITKIKKAELALMESELRLQNIIEATNVGVWEWNVVTNRLAYNAKSAEILGFKKDRPDMSMEAFFTLIHPEDKERLLETYQAHNRDKSLYYEIEMRMRTLDRGWRWMFTRGRIVERDQLGNPKIVSGTHLDIDARKQTELLLVQNQYLMQSLFDNQSIGILFIDEKEDIFQVNNRFVEILGREDAEVIGQNAFAFHFLDDQEIIRQGFNRAIRMGKPELALEERFRKPNGDEVWVSLYFSFIRNEEGEYKYSIALAEDITERRTNRLALDRSRALLQATLETLPDLKFRVNQKGDILEVYAIEGVVQFFGAKTDQLIGKNVEVFLPIFASQGLKHNIKKVLENRQVETLALLVPRDNAVQHYEARLNSINRDEVIIVVRNVTEKMLTEQKLYESIHDMEVNNRKLQRYIDSNLQLENFAYIASHDLREPVRTMRTFAQVIDKRYRKLLDEDGQTYLDFVINSAEQMNQLIMDLLAYSRVNSEETLSQEINMSEFMKEIVSNLAQTINENQVVLDTQGSLPQVIFGSQTKLKQLFQNLISNAIKFRKPDVDPYIKVSCKESINNWQFSIKDNGIGIKPEFFEIIFAMFKKLHNQRDYQGTGMGLAICKKIVEQHGGEIWVESIYGEGATFYFTISKPEHAWKSN